MIQANANVSEEVRRARQHIDQELSAMELGDLRTEEQVRDLFLALEAHATRTQLGRAEKLKLALLVEGADLTQMPALCIKITSNETGSKSIQYLEVLGSPTAYTPEDLNPSSSDSLLFHPDRLPLRSLGAVDDARLVTPTSSMLRKLLNQAQTDRLEVLTHDLSRITYVDGVPATWDGRRIDVTAWSTNIDTVFCSGWLRDSGIVNSRVQHSLEIGSGIGGISQAILHNCPNLHSHRFTDIDPHAINATRRNLRPLTNGRSVSWSIGKGIPNGAYDLIVTNPPYLPHPRGDGDKDHYSGTKLIKRLFTDGIDALNPENPEACICVQMSHVTLPDFVGYMREHQNVKVTLLGRKVEVPLRILGLLRDPEVLNNLIDNCGLRDKPRAGYPFPLAPYTSDSDPRAYYHDIMLFKLQPRR